MQSPNAEGTMVASCDAPRGESLRAHSQGRWPCHANASRPTAARPATFGRGSRATVQSETASHLGAHDSATLRTARPPQRNRRQWFGESRCI